MGMFRRGPYAVVLAALVLVVGLGGATYAAGLITGADIKDGSVTSADIRDSTLKLRDFSDTAKAGLKGAKGDPGAPGSQGPQGPSDAYAVTDTGDTVLTGSFATVLSLDLPAGNYVASVTAIAYEVSSDAGAFADCILIDGTGYGESAVTIPTGGMYASVSAQAVFSADAPSTLEFKCLGSNAGINKVVLTAVSVGALHGG